MVKRGWLSVTPEPERELPLAVAVLRHHEGPDARAIAAEEARIEALLLRGRERGWDDYLHSVLELIERCPQREAGGELERARRCALEVIANHHNLLLGLPGPGAERTAVDRARLHRLLEDGTVEHDWSTGTR